MMLIAIKRLVRHVVPDYRINWVYASGTSGLVLSLPAEIDFGPLDRSGLSNIATTADPQFRKVLGYERIGATGYALSQCGNPLSVAHFVDASRYENTTTWPLGSNEVALVNIVTIAPARGRRYAAILISHATATLLSGSYSRVIAFIWWNHHASLGAFERAGWCRIGLSVEIVGRNGRIRHMHLPIRRRHVA